MFKKLLIGYSMDHLNFQTIESLPDTIPGRFVSQPVIFVVNNKRYAGHYHMNGFFYSDCCDMMAKTSVADSNFRGRVEPYAQLWCYL